MSFVPELTLASGPQLDAFARLRVSDPYTIFDSKLLADKGSLYWEEETNGTATSVHSTTDACVSMSVSANNDRVIRQTYMRFNYQPGKSQMVLLTGILGDPVASTEARIGYFNSSATSPYTADRDGIYWGTDGTDVYVAVSKTGTETKVTQSSWNIDTLDGTGPSGITADWTGTNIFGCDFEWLGVGSVRMFLVVDGMPVPVHQFNNANVGQTGAYMSSPNHSLRYEIRSTGGTNTIKQVCGSVMSEGGVEPSGISRGFNTGIITQTIGTTLEAMIGYRLKSTHLTATIITEFLSLIPTGNEDTTWELQLNPTYANTPSWTSAGESSPAEYAVGDGANTVSASGEILATGYVSDNTNELASSAKTVLHAGVSLDGTRDEIWLCARSVSGTGAYLGSINVRELNIG